MTVTLELEPNVAAKVKTAQTQGVDMNAVLDKALPLVSNQSAFLREQAKQQIARPTPEQLNSALAAIAQMGQGRGYLTDEAFDRENLYEDRV